MKFCFNCKFYKFDGYYPNGSGQYGKCAHGGNRVRWNDSSCNLFTPKTNKK